MKSAPPTYEELLDKVSTLQAFASHDSHKIKRLVDMLIRADGALETCGVGKKSPVRVNINSVLKSVV